VNARVITLRIRTVLKTILKMFVASREFIDCDNDEFGVFLRKRNHALLPREASDRRNFACFRIPDVPESE
jgi:hypothetical protein